MRRPVQLGSFLLGVAATIVAGIVAVVAYWLAWFFGDWDNPPFT